MRKKIFLLALAAMLLPLFASAETVEIDGICYNLIPKGSAAEVVKKQSGRYSGDIVIPENFVYNGVNYNVTSISDYAFTSCEDLYSVTIPNGVKSIGDRAFEGCKSLSAVHISDVASWCQIHFYNNPLRYAHHLYLNGKEINELIIPDEVTSISSNAFSDCESFKSVVIGNGITSVTGFENCKNLTSVTMGSNVTSVTGFKDCKNLTSITIGPNVESISAFKGCDNIESVYISDLAKWCSIKFEVYHNLIRCFTAPHLFLNGKEVKDLVIPEGVTSISDFAFIGFKYISSVTIPNSVTSIGNFAFSGKIIDDVDAEFDGMGISTVTIGNGLRKVGYNAFFMCGNLKSVHISDLAAWCRIRYDTFSDDYVDFYEMGNPLACAHHLYLNGKEIKDMTIPDGVTNINKYAFYGMSELTSVSIPGSVKSIGVDAFYECKNLTSVHISDVAAWCSTKFEDNTLYKSHHIYMDGKEITDLVIPDGVTTIRNNAFYGCKSLTSLRIPASVKNIGANAFAYCEELANVTCLAKSVPSTSSNAFEKSYIEYARLYVDKESVDAYKSATPWNKFKSIEAVELPKYILTYMIDGEVYKTVEYEEGDKINAESGPKKEGYTFSGWSGIPNTMPGNDVTVKGSFTVNKYRLIYKVDGTVYKTIEVEYGSVITPEAYPTKDGYNFSGWNGIPDTMPAESVIVTGTFSKCSYTLTYIIDGVIYKKYTYGYDERITPENAPNKEGYTFTGWSGLPNTMPAGDVTVTGSYTVNKYRLIYMVDGEVYMTIDVEYGSSITPENEPTRDGYVFSGWSWIPTKMPAEDVTVSGTFKRVGYNVSDNIYVIDGNEASFATTNVTSGDLVINPVIEVNNTIYYVTSVAENSCMNNTSITSVTIPDGVQSIGDNAFYGCTGVKSLSLGKVIGYIGNKAFAYIGTSASSRKRAASEPLVIECHAFSVPKAQYDSFEGVDMDNTILKVDDNLVNSYKSVFPWSLFTNIIGFNESTDIQDICSDEGDSSVFSIDGRRIDKPQKGMNIIRTSQGTRKIMVK